MKNLLIICNVIFLLVGNVLFSNIHYLNEHNHENHANYECEECIIIENSTNYFTDFDEEKFLKNKTFQFVLEYFSAIDLSSAKYIFPELHPSPNKFQSRLLFY